MKARPSTPSSTVRIREGLFVLSGAVNTGALVSGEDALLFDCCDSVTPDRLAALGVGHVDTILCTQHRRPNAAGAYAFVERGARLAAPAGERHLFEDVDAYWCDPTNRWHIYHHQPGPQVLARPLPVDRTVKDGDVVDWHGYSIRVLDTPGATDGAVSYIVDVEDQVVCFSGDAISGAGQVWDLYSLQKGTGEIRDYHGFLGNLRLLTPSLRKLATCGADLLIPSHGDVIGDPASATHLLLDRLDAVWGNYTSISSLNHYFPTFFEDTRDDPARMQPVPTVALPAHVRRVAFTSFAIVSEAGAAFLIDCGDASVVETLQDWVRDGTIAGVEACWITHYHDDHVDALSELQRTFGCPIICDEHQVDIIQHPSRFFLPCISPHPATISRVTSDGETWRWREFELSAFHFPGQTYYGGGLLVIGKGSRVFFAGDSGSPTGLDDHCPGNRNFLGAGRGFRRCFALWEELAPDIILNQHQDLGFRFSEADLRRMHATLVERERLFAALSPWPHPNFATDQNWVRTYPHEQEVTSGQSFWIDVRFTNHGSASVTVRVEPVLPRGWCLDGDARLTTVQLPARTSGIVGAFSGNADRAARMWIRTDAAEPGLYVVPIRVTLDDRYLGQFRHAIVRVTHQ